MTFGFMMTIAETVILFLSVNILKTRGGNNATNGI